MPYKDLGVSVDYGSQLNSLFQKVCAILTNYLICNVPAATVLAVDPYARRLSKVQTTLLHININFFLDLTTIQTCFQQAHIPTYVLAWLSVIINPLLYVLCNPAYRFEK